MHLSKQQLLEKLVCATALAGWEATALDSPPEHPFRLRLTRQDEHYEVRVYIWNISHGGANRAANEFRIQITGVPSVDTAAGAKTLVMGYWADNDVFAGWDVRRHSGAIAYSPSLQISEDALLEAHERGFSFYRKANNEVAFAFDPSRFVTYVLTLEGIHDAVSEAEQELLREVVAAEGQVEDTTFEVLPEERRRVAAGFTRLLRDSRFRERVLAAYGHRCAVCGLQLDLVEAAHIIPVPATRNDTTPNGLCLCVLHHRAFDQKLIAVGKDYRVRVNRDAINRLRAIGHDAGETTFIRGLRAQIILPAEVTQRPRTEFIETALQLRTFGTVDLVAPIDLLAEDEAEEDDGGEVT